MAPIRTGEQRKIRPSSCAWGRMCCDDNADWSPAAPDDDAPSPPATADDGVVVPPTPLRSGTRNTSPPFWVCSSSEATCMRYMISRSYITTTTVRVGDEERGEETVRLNVCPISQKPNEHTYLRWGGCGPLGGDVEARGDAPPRLVPELEELVGPPPLELALCGG